MHWGSHTFIYVPGTSELEVHLKRKLQSASSHSTAVKGVQLHQVWYLQWIIHSAKLPWLQLCYLYSHHYYFLFSHYGFTVNSILFFLNMPFAKRIRNKAHRNINIDMQRSVALALTLMFLCISAAWHSYKAADQHYFAAFDFHTDVNA